MREVWRTAYALLDDAFEGDPPVDQLRLFDGVPRQALDTVRQMLRRDLNAPPARGIGRYFDAFGALGLMRSTSTYEGQIAVAWNFAAETGGGPPYAFSVDTTCDPFEIDLRPTARAAVADLVAGVPEGRVSARFHATLAEATATVVERLWESKEPLPVALTGGVFQNALLCAAVESRLSKEIRVLRHREVPPGDGGIALGQALIADAILRDKD